MITLAGRGVYVRTPRRIRQGRPTIDSITRDLYVQIGLPTIHGDWTRRKELVLTVFTPGGLGHYYLPVTRGFSMAKGVLWLASCSWGVA